MSDTIKVSVPSDLAELLVGEGHAIATRGRRSSLWALDGAFLGQTATVIALLQAPQTVVYLAKAIRRLAARARAEGTASRSTLSVEAVGPAGQIRIDGEATVEEIERLLRQTLFTETGDPGEIVGADGTD
ncbi:hypothetical protein AB0K68_32615 [Streptomyces sp. NPDC050698]